MRRDKPPADGDATLVSAPPGRRLYYEDDDMSSLALCFVPFPLTAGFTMDVPGGGRLSTSASERVGLLEAGKVQQQQQQGEEEEEEEEVQTTGRKEAKLLARYSLPLMATYLLQYSFTLITLFAVGHLGTDELGAVSLASMTANITGLAIYEGLATSLDTLCAQAYGSGNKELVGLHLQRMVLLMLLATMPIGIMWLSSGWVLAALVPAKEQAVVAHVAGRYLSILVAGAPGYALFEAGKRFTQAQGLFHASLWVLLMATPVHLVLNYLLVFVLPWRLEGAALATVLSHNLLPILLWLHVYFVNPSALQCWPGFTRQACRHWGPMARLAVPGILMVETEWLAFDILTFSTSYLSTAHLAAQSIVMSLAVAMYHVPFSVGVAVSTRLGHLIGAGCLSSARRATRTYMVTFVVIGVVDFGFLTATRNALPKAFSSDAQVVAIVSTVLPLLAVFQCCDATTALANAMLRGLGLQAMGGCANLLVYHVIAVPLALFWCFAKDGKLVGLWAGCAVGSSCITVIEGVYMYCYDWKRAIDAAKTRDE
ncbi:hypothetical protein ACEQ8H_006619 [Pleosporales sp. CAS-2024a]